MISKIINCPFCSCRFKIEVGVDDPKQVKAKFVKHLMWECALK